MISEDVARLWGRPTLIVVVATPDLRLMTTDHGPRLSARTYDLDSSLLFGDGGGRFRFRQLLPQLTKVLKKDFDY